MEMPFGKHKGMRLEEVPKHYLLWILDNCEMKSPTLKHEIEKILGLQPAEGRKAKTIVDKFKPIYRRMASKYHPDRGGSTEEMIAINDFWEAINQALKQPSHPDFFN